MFELVYTSLPQGLLAGRSGFTTAALTGGFPGNLISPIENLSGYKTLFPPGHPDEKCNPVNYSCQHYRFGATLYIVLSRISFYGLSYTGRSNILAHHLLFTADELLQIPGGPLAVLLAQENFPPWSGNPGMLPQKSLKNIKRKELPQSGEGWKKWAGDERWADYVAELFRNGQEKKLALAFDPKRISGGDILELYAEISAKLTPEEQLNFTFNTYSYSSAIANPVFLRAFPESSTLLGSMKRLNPASVVELGKDNPLPEGWRPGAAAFGKTAAEFVTEENAECVAEEDNGAEEENLPEIVPEKGTDPADIFYGEEKKITKKKMVTFNTSAPEVLPFPFDVEEEKKRIAKELEKKNKENNSSLLPVRIGAALLFILLIAAFIWAVAFRSAKMPEEQELKKEKSELELEFSGVLEKEMTGRKNDFSIREKELPGKVIPEKTMADRKEVRKEDFSSSYAGKNEENAETAFVVTESVKNGKITEKKASVTVDKRDIRETAGEKKYGVLTKKELFSMYIQYWKRPFSGKLILPASLRETSGIQIELSGIGKKIDKEQEKYIFGNGGEWVYVSSAVWVDGTFPGYQPSEDVDGRMTFKVKNGVLSVKEPAEEKGKINPLLSNIKNIRFLDKTGKEFFFDPYTIPAGFEKELEKDYGKITVKREGTLFLFFLRPSGLLWDFRNFFTLKVNGKILRSGISGKEILLQKVDTEKLSGLLHKRNQLLLDWRKTEKVLASFRMKNKKNLTYPVFSGMKKIMKLAPVSGKKLLTAVKEKKTDLSVEIPEVKEEINHADPAKLEEVLNNAGSSGKPAKGEQNLKTNLSGPEENMETVNKKEILLNTLVAWEKKVESFAEMKEKENEYAVNCRKAEMKFKKSNIRLAVEMGTFSVKLYNAKRKELQSFAFIKMDIPGVMEKQGLYKRIRIEIIRRNDDGND